MVAQVIWQALKQSQDASVDVEGLSLFHLYQQFQRFLLLSHQPRINFSGEGDLIGLDVPVFSSLAAILAFNCPP